MTWKRALGFLLVAFLLWFMMQNPGDAGRAVKWTGEVMASGFDWTAERLADLVKK